MSVGSRCRARLAAGVALSCLLVIPAHSAAIAGVVFGNLGSSGTNSVGSLNSAFSFEGTQLAQGFTAASPRLTVQSVSLWLSGSSTSAFVSIYDAAGGSFAGSPGDPIAISGPRTISAKGLYQFSFTNGVELTSGTNYWIIPESEAADPIAWYLTGTAPTQQNSSGYVYTQALQRSVGFWVPSPSNNVMSVSINAVPEPSTSCMVLAGLACGGFSMWRRRRRA